MILLSTGIRQCTIDPDNTVDLEIGSIFELSTVPLATFALYSWDSSCICPNLEHLHATPSTDLDLYLSTVIIMLERMSSSGSTLVRALACLYNMPAKDH